MKPNHLHIVLHEPEIPQNTGNIARLAAATCCRLHIVKPTGFHLTDKNLRRSGLDYWPFLDLEIHDDWQACLKRLPQEPTNQPAFLTTKGTQSIRELPPSTKVIVFGKETAGLPQALLDEAPERMYKIPMYSPHVRSLNLANAVSIVAYQLLAACDGKV